MHTLSRLFPFAGRLLLVALSVTGGRAAQAEPPAFDLLYGERELFPSVLVSLTATSPYLPGFAKPGETVPPTVRQLGDPTGVVAVRIRNPAANSRVTVKLAETALFAESSVAEVLPVEGETYYVAPTVRWDYERLATLKQPIANFVLKAVVEIGDQRHEIFTKTVVHSVNDWLQRYKLRGSDDWVYSAKYLAAAYVNENSHLVDQITQRAFELTKPGSTEKLVTAFSGYTGQSILGKKFSRVDRVELEAVYRTLQVLGFKYTALSQASFTSHPDTNMDVRLNSRTAGALPGLHKDARVYSQNVRLLGDAMAARQASRLEGAAILASVYRKLGLHVIIMIIFDSDTVRSEALVGVYGINPASLVRPDPMAVEESLVVIDPERISSDSFEEAVKRGQQRYRQFRDKLVPVPADDMVKVSLRRLDENNGYLWIDLTEARAQGVLPIPEFEPAPVRRL